LEKKYIKTISRYSLKGQLLETYPNAKVAAEAMNSNQSYLSGAARPNGNHILRMVIYGEGEKRQRLMLNP